MTVKICWSGLTGRVGLAALRAARERDDVQIVAGVSRMKMDQITHIDDVSVTGIRWYQYPDSYSREVWGDMLYPQRWTINDVDIFVDFSRPKQLSNILTSAVLADKPVIVGTSGFTPLQLTQLEYYARAIPIFQDVNCSFLVKKFMDRAVEFARGCKVGILYENLYHGADTPSAVALNLRERIKQVTNQEIEILSKDELSPRPYVRDWWFEDINCQTVGFEQLAHNVFDIARLMVTKKSDLFHGVYYLDEIWDEIPKSQFSPLE